MEICGIIEDFCGKRLPPWVLAGLGPKEDEELLR